MIATPDHLRDPAFFTTTYVLSILDHVYGQMVKKWFPYPAINSPDN